MSEQAREEILHAILDTTDFAEKLARAAEITEPRYLQYTIDEEEEPDTPTK